MSRAESLYTVTRTFGQLAPRFADALSEPQRRIVASRLRMIAKHALATSEVLAPKCEPHRGHPR